MIKVGDVVSAGGPDAYTVESISGDGMAMCYWECGQGEVIHVSKLTKLDHIYFGNKKINVNEGLKENLWEGY